MIHMMGGLNFLVAILENISEESKESDRVLWRDELNKDLKKMPGDPAYKESAFMVRAARRGNDMTQKELAKKLDIDPKNLSHIERARRPVGKKLAHKLGKVFNVGYKVFLTP